MSEISTRVTAIWGDDLLVDGFSPIPNFLIRHYRELGIEHGEWGFICTVLSFKHDSRDPYPEQSTLAGMLKVSTRQIRKWTDSLVKKRLLLVVRRYNGSLVYNFTPLLHRVQSLLETEPQVPVEPEVPLASNVSTGPEVPANRFKRFFVKKSTTTSTKINAHEDAPKSPTQINAVQNFTTPLPHEKIDWGKSEFNDFYAKIRAAMRRRTPGYHPKEKDIVLMHRLLDSHVPVDFIMYTLDDIFSERPNTPINAFAYCEPIIAERWANELAKSKSVEPIEFNQVMATEAPTPRERKARPGKNANNAKSTKRHYDLYAEHNSPEIYQRYQETGRDERYEAFYALFPDEVRVTSQTAG